MRATYEAVKWILIIIAVILAAPILGMLLAIGMTLYVLKVLFQMEIDDAARHEQGADTDAQE